MPGPGWLAFNPSVVHLRDSLAVSIRLKHPGHWDQQNLLGRLDDHWKLIECRPMIGVTHEDVRLFERPEGLSAVGIETQPGRHPKVVVLDLDNDGTLLAAHVQPSERPERNWMPVVRNGQLDLVYRADPLQVMTYDDAIHRVAPKAMSFDAPHSSSPYADGARGSSQLVAYEGGFLAVVHERLGERRYFHRFARFNHELTRSTLGPPWILEHEGIEFVCGLAQYRDHWVISYGSEDMFAQLALLNTLQLKPWLPDEPEVSSGQAL